MLDTVPFGLHAGLNNVWSLKKSEKLEIWLTFDHRIHAVVNEKKTYEFFLLSKLKVKMASILYFSDIEEFADSYNWFPNLYQRDIFQIKL